jgi:hypothetical protein
MSGRGLSLTAELLWLSVDPATGKPFVRLRRRGRFKKALAATGRTREDATAELERARLLDDGAAARTRFRELQDAIRKDAVTSERDVELLALLGWTGVLAQRLPKAEQKVAGWRLRRLGKSVRSVPRAVAELGFVTADGTIDGEALLTGSGLEFKVRGPTSGDGPDFTYIGT